MCCLCMPSQLCLEWLGRRGGILVDDDLLALVLRLLAVAKEDDLDREIISVCVCLALSVNLQLRESINSYQLTYIVANKERAVSGAPRPSPRSSHPGRYG